MGMTILQFTDKHIEIHREDLAFPALYSQYVWQCQDLGQQLTDLTMLMSLWLFLPSWIHTVS